MTTNSPIDGPAIVYCEKSFNTTNGKTAHGLVRFTHRYNVCCVIDSVYSGQDAGKVLDNKDSGIPVVATLEEALKKVPGNQPVYFVVGLAPDGGRLNQEGFEAVKEAIRHGLHVDCGLHDFLTENDEIVKLAERHGVRIRDIRKPPSRSNLHFFSGDIEEVGSLKIALLGTDSAIGKRTTAWILTHALQAMGRKAELIGTGQTAWLQGARYSMVMDSLVNDFVSGEIEHAVVSAWRNERPDFIIIEGQGSLMNPAYPGGFEILAAGRPDIVILQHAPARKEYDGFPGYPLHSLDKQIQAIEMLSGHKVVAITINHEDMNPEEVHQAANAIEQETGLPAWDPLLQGGNGLAELMVDYWKTLKGDQNG